MLHKIRSSKSWLPKAGVDVAQTFGRNSFFKFARAKPVFVLLAIIICGLIVLPLAAQEKQGSVITKANDYYAALDFHNAALTYEKIRAKKTNVSIMEKLASSYENVGDYANANRWYKAIVAQPSVDAIFWLRYANVLKATGKYDEAKQMYLMYTTKGHVPVDMQIASCDSAKQWLATAESNNFSLEALRGLNTHGADNAARAFGPNKIVFSSDSTRFATLDPTSKKRGKKNKNDVGVAKLYSASISGNNVSGIAGLGNVFNIRSLPTSDICFSPDGNTAYYATTYRGGQQNAMSKKSTTDLPTIYIVLYISEKRNGKWLDGRLFQWNSPNRFSITHPAISNDGSTLYFVSNMPGGLGKSDIWFSKKNADGTWTKPVNCGPNVNTQEDESYPTFGTDSNTIYFSSKGRLGMGGYDIFVTHGKEDSWSIPENMKAPINSPSDDFYLTPETEQSGYVSSNRPGGVGSDDIYKYLMKVIAPKVAQIAIVTPKTATIVDSNDVAPIEAEAPTADSVLVKNVTPDWVTALSINVLDRKTEQPIEGAKIELQKDRDDFAIAKSSNNIGNTTFSLEPNTNYVVTASKSKYAAVSKTITTEAYDKDTTLSIQLYLDVADNVTDKEVVAGTDDNTKVIYYDFNKWDIRPEAFPILDTIAQTMQETPTINLKIDGYTDARGSDEYNVELSWKRAESVLRYLMAKGISPSRMIAKGWGETNLVNKCGDGIQCSEDEHQANRRTVVSRDTAK